MMKKRTIIIAAAMIAMLLISSSFAYLMAHKEKINPFTVGENEISISEDFHPPEKILPGSTYVKTPYVKNINNINCYIRMFRGYSDESASRYTEFRYKIEGDSYESAIIKHDAEENYNYISDYNTVDWEYNDDDGYYYYKHILAPGETAIPLFNTVKTLSSRNDGENTEVFIPNDINDYDIIIYSESVQSADYTNYSDAWTAFELCTDEYSTQ